MDHWISAASSGDSHINAIRRTAEALHAKHPADVGYKFFARLGNKKGKNVERDFHRRLQAAYGSDLEPYFIKIPLHGIENPDSIEMVNVATIAPYEMFAELYKHRSSFDEFVLGGNRCPAEFWTALAKHNSVDHEVMGKRRTTIPTYWHTDGGEVYKDCEFSIWSWTSALVGDVDSVNAKHLVLAIEEARKVHHLTDAFIVKYINFNLQVMVSGKYPDTNWLGEPLDARRARLAGTPLAGVRNRNIYIYIWSGRGPVGGRRLLFLWFFSVGTAPLAAGPRPGGRWGRPNR